MICEEKKWEELFSTLISKKLPLFRKISCQIVNSAADADDAVQNALVRAWGKRKEFRGENTTLAGWVSKIVITASYDLLRRRARRQKLCKIFLPAVQPAADPMLEKLDNAIAQLPELYRETIHIAVLSGIPTAEAADLLGCSVNTLYQRIHKAKELLNKNIRSINDEL